MVFLVLNLFVKVRLGIHEYQIRLPAGFQLGYQLLQEVEVSSDL